jgi:hypothetical protein
MRISPLAAGCIAAVLGGTVAVLLSAWRTQQELEQKGREVQAGLVSAGRISEANLRRLADGWARDLEELGRVKIQGAATAEATRVVEQEYGITPAFIADMTNVQRQIQAARDNPWATVRTRLAAML